MRFLVLLSFLCLSWTSFGWAQKVPLTDSERTLLKEMKVEMPTMLIEAHNFEMKLMDGRELPLSEFRGKFVLLNFWATWCAPCLREMPDMEALQENVGSENLTVLAVSMGETEERVQKFLKMHGFTFPIVADTSMEIVQLYGVKNIPITYLISPEGVILGRALGPREWNRISFQEFVKSRVAG